MEVVEVVTTNLREPSLEGSRVGRLKIDLPNNAPWFSRLGATIVDLSRVGGEKHKRHSYDTSAVVA